jgi:hypothetical protein
MLARCLLLFLLISLEAKAQIGAVFGNGAVSGAMGGTSIQQDKPSPYNSYGAPAALGFLRVVEVSAGIQYMKPVLKPFGSLVLNSNGTLGEFRTAGVMEGGGNLLAFAFPIGRKRPLTVAASFYLPFTSLVRVSGAPVNYPFYPLYNDISRNLFFVVGAGYEIFTGWAFGVNVRSTTKSIALYALRADNTVNYSASAVEARSQSRLSFSLLHDHARVNPESRWSLGAMYRAKAGLETKLSADISAFVPVQGELTSLPSFNPAEWVLMGSWKPNSILLLSFDAAWVRWSEYVSPYGSGNINSYVIGSTRRDAGFKDIPVPRVGAEFAWDREGKSVRKLAYRMGYLYHPSPVPEQKEDSNFVDNDRHSFTAGLGLGFKNPWREDSLIDLDLFAQYNWLVNRTIRKNSSTNIGAPGYTSGGKIFLYGLAGSIRF